MQSLSAKICKTLLREIKENPNKWLCVSIPCSWIRRQVNLKKKNKLEDLHYFNKIPWRREWQPTPVFA